LKRKIVTTADAERWVTPNIFTYKKNYYELLPTFQIIKVNIVCPECGEERPDDDRVKNGMKCCFCAYPQ